MKVDKSAKLDKLKSKRFNISIEGRDIDCLIRACKFGKAAISKMEEESGEAPLIRFALNKIIRQASRKFSRKEKELLDSEK